MIFVYLSVSLRLSQLKFLDNSLIILVRVVCLSVCVWVIHLKFLWCFLITFSLNWFPVCLWVSHFEWLYKFSQNVLWKLSLLLSPVTENHNSHTWTTSLKPFSERRRSVCDWMLVLKLLDTFHETCTEVVSVSLCSWVSHLTILDRFSKEFSESFRINPIVSHFSLTVNSRILTAIQEMSLHWVAFRKEFFKLKYYRLKSSFSDFMTY